MAPKRNISYTKPAEPSFIKKMKESIGYQEPDTVETKRQVADFVDDGVEREDEKPVVVVLKPGDLNEEEVKEISEKADPSKKITFTKPAKKESEDKTALDFSSKKKELQKRIENQKESTKKVKNASLLSFDDEEEEEY
ncbi:hypothetical protein JTE90_005057 [Oedothorax gibbosus]|uniref:DUF4604 domain-containing protein n=1 Tax=Oedothorax gibbosus TaxID=931172 RepID=A0AAV6VBK9_9ARAC|nr:hypothetical protein JTE90_005057 [Oedothorax gibbosus]